MADLVHTSIASLDGFVADEHGGFDWAAPDEEVHGFVNDLERAAGTYLYGRRMYEVMAFWDTHDPVADPPTVGADYAAVWQAADKVVFSTTLSAVGTARTRLERVFRPDAVRALKDASDRTLSIGGPTLAASAYAAGLVDECRLFLVPEVVGAGTRCLPPDVRLGLDLLEERRFRSGVVYLRYRVRR